MRKGFILFISILVIVAGAWYGQNLIRNQGVPNSGPISSSEEKPSGEEPVVPNDELKEQALIIARSQFVVKKQLPVSVIEQAKQKINDAVNLIEANYDYDAPWLELGGYRRLVGDYDGAIAAWKFLTVIRPNAFVPYHNLGDLYAFTFGDHAKGEMYFLTSLEVGPGNIQGYLSLVVLYKDSTILKKQSQIDDILLRGLENNNKNFNLLYELANYYKETGDRALAIKYFEEALSVNPGDKSISEELSKLRQ